MPDQFFYTAIFRPSSGEILTSADGVPYAEHFVDEVERNKRAKQFEAHARSLGEVDPWFVYAEDEPIESFFARKDFRLYSENGKETVDEYQKAMDIDAAKAGAKTVSVLTAPEIDDSQEARPLPAWAVAQAEVEKAERAVVDAKEAHVALQLRADNLAEEAYATGAASDPEDVKMLKRRRAVNAQTEADQAKARLYHAEGDYAAKANTFKLLMEAEQVRAQESHKK